MSIAQDVFTDPAQLAWDKASRDPLEILTEAERAEAEQLTVDADNSSTLAEAALVIGGGFILYRVFMERRLRQDIRPDVTRLFLGTAVDIWGKQFLPIWITITASAFARAAALGVDTQRGEIPDELLFSLGDDYAERIGVYMHQSSKEALLEGFTSYLNKRVPRKVAAERSLAGFGLTRKQHRGLGSMKAPAIVNSAREINPDLRNQAYIEQALLTRAKELGNQEAFSVSQEGRQLGWMYQAQEGKIPEGARRVWATARDERVCRSCGPMHRKSAPLNEPFETPQGNMWTPGLHPNCRCEIKLQTMPRPFSFLSKAYTKVRDGDSDGSIWDGTKMERLIGTKTLAQPDTAPQKLGQQLGDRLSDHRLIPDTRLGARLDQLSSVNLGSPARLQAEPLVQTKLSSARLIEAIEAIPEQKLQVERIIEAQVQTAPPVPKLQPQVKPKAKTTTKATSVMSIPSKYAADDELMGDRTAKDFNDVIFGTYDKALNVAYETTVDRISDKVVDLKKLGIHKHPVMLPDGTALEGVELTDDELYTFVEAEVLGLPDSPGRKVAQQWGVDRKDFLVEIYEIDQIDTSKVSGDVRAYENNDEWEISGPYEVISNATLSDNHIGVPFVIRQLRIEGAPEDEALD